MSTLLDLLGRDENALTRGFALTLRLNYSLFKAFIEECEEKWLYGKKHWQDSEIKCQVSKPFHGVTDIEISIMGELHLIVEAKVGGGWPTHSQIQKYLKRFDGSAKHEVMVLLVNYIMEQKLNLLKSKIGNKVKIRVVTWEVIRNISRQILSRSKNDVDRLFLNALEERFMDEEILIVAADSEIELEILENERFYRFPVEGKFPKRKAKYLAIYYSGSICKIAKIKQYKQITKTALNKRLRKYYSNLKPGKYKYWLLELDELIDLPRPIINKKGRRVSYQYTSLEKIIFSTSLEQLRNN